MKFFLFLLFFVFAIDELVLVASNETMRLELVHRHSPKMENLLGERPRTRLEHIKYLYRRDIFRHRLISRRRRNTETTSSIAMPMHSGADYGTGEYFVHLKVGTPGQKFMLVADTGSELTWMNCRYHCRRNCTGIHRGRLNNKRVFRADRSSSFETVPCLSEMCKVDLANLFSLTLCPTPLTPCAYDYRYMEGLAAMGFFAKETVSVGLTSGRKEKLKDVLIGCTESISGDQRGTKGADGVLGLGYGKHTFTSQASSDFGGKFSYCLVDHLSPKNISNYIVFGQNKIETCLLNTMRRTNLLLGGAFGSFYGLNIKGISIGGALLRIPSATWNIELGGGTILDSGSSLTYLAEPAYGPVTATLSKSLSGFHRLPAEGGPFEFCFNSTGFNESSAPKLAIHFGDGAKFEPPVKSYIIDVAKQKKCLGFVSISWPGNSIIGNILQQNHLWEFDLVRRSLGFAPSSCT